MAPTWQGVMTISVHHKLRPGPCKSLCAPNIVGPILARFRYSCYFLPFPKYLLHAILLYFILVLVNLTNLAHIALCKDI
jgi:hypothetical protein